MSPIDLVRYSDLLLDYCLEIKPGDKLLVQSTTLAEPLIRELYKGTLVRGGIIEILFSFEGQENIINQHAHEHSVQWISPTYEKAMREFDAYLYIRAPFPPSEYIAMDKTLFQMRKDAIAPISKIYNERTGNRSLRRSLCQYPTLASAKEANMSLEEYEEFVLAACFLNKDDAIAAWKKLSLSQQHVVDYLNTCENLQYKNSTTDISFSVKNRTWINSDGRTNMPSGEVYTSPIEDSINGYIYFDYPFLYNQQTIQGVSLTVQNGKVIHAHAIEGNSVLQEIITTTGADHFGEVAIGTNQNISIGTKNILFDEKMAGTVHMALGQSYLQCGGKNESSVHQDMIADMKEAGQIFADGKLIYQNGVFLIN